MDEQNQNLNVSVPQAAPEAPRKSKFWKFAVWFVVIVIVAGVALWVVDYFSPEARYARMAREGQEQYENLVKLYQDELRADVYGGKTPEETLRMFVEALRSGDVELASKYFFVDASGDRSKWIDFLNGAKEAGQLNQMANDIESDARPLETSDSNDYAFALFNKDGTVGVLIDMKFNEFAEIWKIESL